MASNVDILYVASSPKTGMEKYDNILLAAGISKAAEMGLPALRNVVEFTDEATEIVGQDGYQVPFADCALMKIIAAQGKLKRDADKNGIWVDFDIDGDTGHSLRHEAVGLESNRGPLTARIRKRYSFMVNGYYSKSDSLFRNIDSLSKEENVERVEEAVGKDKAGPVYSMIDIFSKYSPERNRKIVGWRGAEMPAFMRENAAQTNTEKIFGLADDRLYTDLKGLLNEEVRQKYGEVESSKIAGLSDSKCRVMRFIGSKYREHKTGGIENHRAKKEKQIDDMRKRFSEPYKSTRANAASFTK